MVSKPAVAVTHSNSLQATNYSEPTSDNALQATTYSEPTSDNALQATNYNYELTYDLQRTTYDYDQTSTDYVHSSDEKYTATASGAAFGEMFGRALGRLVLFALNPDSASNVTCALVFAREYRTWI